MRKTMIALALVMWVAPRSHGQVARTPDSVSVLLQKMKEALNSLQPLADKLRAENRPSPPADPFARYLFPPELVMSNQQAISLSDRQRSAILEAMKAPQGTFIDLKLKMSAEAEKLQLLLQSASVDESKVLEQVDRVLSIEREVKRAQVTMMIRTKNQLTEAQQTLLGKIRNDEGRDWTRRPD
jgi:Spy/CpxP family protein refolding chaperone